MDFSSKNELIRHLKEDSNVLGNPLIEKAWNDIDRADFVGEDYKIEAYEDYPLPIGLGQTISQPTTLTYMLDLLGVMEGDNVLDVGSGSGFTTTLLASTVGKNGHVLGVDIVPELVTLGQNNLAKYKFPHASIVEASEKEIGKNAPYDKILVSAGATELPEELIAVLKTGGAMVIPVEEKIYKIIKTEDGIKEESRSEGDFLFVPYIKK